MFFEYPALLWLLVIPAFMLVHYVYIEVSGRRTCVSRISNSGRPADVLYWV